MEEVVISKQEYEKLKMQAKLAEIDYDLLMQLVQSVKDIKNGNVRRVK